jgi:ParB-like chromosome segregation protein Spo0J
LKQHQKTNPSPPSHQTVRIDQVFTEEETFQPRAGGLNESHVASLVDVLRRGGVLDPIALWHDVEAGKLVVADGHHRFEAYRRHGTAEAPVLVYRCDKAAALLLPIQDNAKARLPLTYDDKASWAWKLTVEGGYSRAEVVASCGVSDGTVAAMRKTLKALQGKREEIPSTWLQAQKQLKGQDQRNWTDEDREAWVDELLAKADRQIGTTLADLIRRSPEAAALLLERCAGGRLPNVLNELGYVHHELSDDDEF